MTQPSMPKDLSDLLAHVRKTSPYYRERWKSVPDTPDTKLGDYPVVDHTSYWAANTCKDSQVITDTHISGVVLKTGGTTGQPKMTFYAKDELRMATQQLGEALITAGIRSYDRVANLFYAGEMYASFLLYVMALMDVTVPLIHLPIGGFCTSEATVEYMRQNEASVVLATPTTMIKLAEYLLEKDEQMPGIRILMFSGEAFYTDQRKRIASAFPPAQVRSVVYGSIDAGAIGYPVSDADSRMHRVATPYIVMEICPDGSTPTTENDVPGTMLVTNLGRRLQPVIRYPSGDSAEWVDYEKGIFRVLGRQGTAVRVGPVSIDIVHLQHIARTGLKSALASSTEEVGAFQAVISRSNGKDVLILRLGCQPPDVDVAKKAVADALNEERPMFRETIELGHIAPLEVEFLRMEEFAINPTSGKLVQLLDERPTT